MVFVPLMLFFPHALAVFPQLLTVAGLLNHFCTQLLFFLNVFDLLHVVLGLGLADFGLSKLEFGEHHLHAARGAEINGVHDG